MKFEDFLARQMRDPEFKRYWEELDLPFQAGNLLLAVRADLDLTQQELAEKAGVKRSYLARIENGQANPTLRSLARILAGVGMRLVLSAEPAQAQPAVKAEEPVSRRSAKANLAQVV